MELSKAIAQRKSTRSFKSKNVDWRLVLEAIDSANQAPFAGNNNNLKFIIAQDKETIQEITNNANQDWLAEASTIIIVCSDDSQLKNLYGERGRLYTKQQSGAAIENLLLALTDKGISCCWVGSFDDKAIRHTLRIPQEIDIEALIPIGYENPKSKTEKKRKKTLESTIFWGSWGKRRKPSIFEEKTIYTN